MTILVLTTRRFKDEFVHEAQYHNAEMRALATVQPGYVSGKTITNLYDPNEMLIISIWESKEEWDDWYKSDERKKYYKKLRLALEKGEEIAFYTETSIKKKR
jgi:heme-degrading monooxygenase HmoA